MYNKELSDILTKKMVGELSRKGYLANSKSKRDLEECDIPYLVYKINRMIEENADFYLKCEEAINEQALDL